MIQMMKISLFFPAIFLILVVLNFSFNWDPYLMNFELILETPQWNAPFGYDDFGRDIFIRLINGFVSSFQIVILATLITFTLGTFLGCLAGFYGGYLDRFLLSVITIIQAFPGILLVIAVAAFLETSFLSILFALTVSSWIGFARIARSQTLSLKEADFVTAAVSMGSSKLRIIKKHIFPNILNAIFVELNFTIANLIIAEAGLSFLGLGVSAPFPSWGSMLRDSVAYLLVAPHYAVFVSFCIISMILSFNAIGAGLLNNENK